MTDETTIVKPPVLEAKQITKTLGVAPNEVHALKGVDVSLRPGELTLLMGPSGSGKTTLLSILGCILKPTSGTVQIVGRSTAGLGPEQLAAIRREHIGLIFQSYNLFPTLTAIENVLLGLDVRGEPKATARGKAEEALTAVRLMHRATAYPRQMSGGEQQRVGIARALAGNPSVVLADEPTAALDGENGQAVMALLAEIAVRQQRAVLVVTHDPRILAYAHRIINIEDGEIASEDRPSIIELKARKRKKTVHA